MVKKSKGRQKITMTKMKNDSNLQVTFSKRRSGLFKKASELCTLCGAEIAIIVFSPGRKVFSFGHPNVESVIDRFLNNNQPLHQHNNMHDEAQRNSIQNLNNTLTGYASELEEEKKKFEELKKIRENTRAHGGNMWDAPIEGIAFSHLEGFKNSLEALKKRVTLEASKFFQAMSSNPNFYMGGSSNACFGMDGGSNINHDLDMVGQRRMMNMNAFSYNPGTNLPAFPLPFGNNGYGNVAEGFAQGHNMNFIPEYNQNLNLGFKSENISEYDYHQGYPPHSGPGPSSYF